MSADRPLLLQQTLETFEKWLGDEYDLDAILVVLAVTASHRLSGDPPWLLLVSGSGNAKTETVQATTAAVPRTFIVSSISSEGAVLSGTPNRETAKDANGGLLRRIGASGLLVIKDVTTILSMPTETRNAVLGALREVHDGRWSRQLGTDGGTSP